MNEKHLQHLWEAYCHSCVPAGASQVQVDATRTAFFAGAVGCFSLVTGGLSPETEPTQADLDLLTAIKTELDEFNASQGVVLQ